MSSRTAIIASSIGLHARPATEFSRKVNACGIPITVGRPDGIRVNGASVLAVMALSITCGEQVVMSTEHPGSEELLDDLVSFLETAHDITAVPITSGTPIPEHA